MSREIIDGKHYLFTCDQCEAPLMDAWVNYEEDSMEWNIIVECCHCGGKSKPQIVKGMFSIGQTEESAKYTAIDGFCMEDNPIIVKTAQVEKYVK